MNLSDVIVGDSVIIKKINVPGSLGERLMEQGLVNGTKIEVTRKASYSPMVVFIRGCYLAMRLEQAEQIIVE